MTRTPRNAFLSRGRNWVVLLAAFACGGLMSGAPLRAEIYPPAERLLMGSPKPVSGVQISPDGRHVVGACDDSVTRVWNSETGELERSLQLGGPCAVLTPDGKQLVVGFGKIVRLVDFASGEVVRDFKQVHPANVVEIAISPRGDFAVTSSRTRDVVCVWKIPSGELVYKFDTKAAAVRGLAFTKDDRFLFSADANGTIRQHDISAKKESRQWATGSKGLTWLTVSPDGNRLLEYGEQSGIIVRDLTTYKKVMVIETGATQVIRSCRYSPDGRTIAICGQDRFLSLCDAESGEERVRVAGFRHHTLSIGYSADGRRIALGCADDPVCLFDVAGLQQAATAQREQRPLAAIVEGMEAITMSEQDGWGGIPEFLSGATIYSKRAAGRPKDFPMNQLTFTVKQGGVAYVAASWSYDGNKDGGWKEKALSRSQLLEQGWQDIGRLTKKRNSKETDDIVLLAKVVKAGETIQFHTRKYNPPFLIIPAPDKIAIAPALAAPDRLAFNVHGMEAKTLTEDDGWSLIPDYFIDATIYNKRAASRPKDLPANQIYVTINQPGIAYVAASWTYDGNSDGGWQQTSQSAFSLLGQGWEYTGRLVKRRDDTDDVYGVYAKFVDAGETIKFHTRKYIPPYLIVPEPSRLAMAPQPSKGRFKLAAEAGPTTLAVLNFVSKSNNPEHAALGIKLAETLATDLSAYDGVRVVERGGAMFLRSEQFLKDGFKQPKGTPATRTLPAELLLSGSIQVDGRTVKARGILNRGNATKPIAEWNVSGPADDLPALKQQLLTRLTAELELTKAPWSSVPQKLVVLPFQNLGDKEPDVYWREEALTLLTEKLSRHDRIKTVEPAALDKVLAGQKPPLATFTDQENSVRLGRLTGADAVVCVSLLPAEETVQLQAHVVDVATGKVFSRHSVTGIHEWRDGLVIGLGAAVVTELYNTRRKANAAAKPDDAERDRAVSMYLSLAVELNLQQKYADAARAYQQALQLAPNDPDLHRNLIGTLFRNGSFNEAIKAVEVARSNRGFQAASEDFHHWILEYGLNALEYTQKYDAYLKYAQEMQAEIPRHKEFYAGRREWMLSATPRGKNSESLEDFQKRLSQTRYTEWRLWTLWNVAIARSNAAAGRSPDLADRKLATQKVIAILEHVLKECEGKRDQAAADWHSIIAAGMGVDTINEARNRVDFLSGDEQVAYFERAYEIFSWDGKAAGELLYHLAFLYRKLDRLADAEQTFGRLARLDVVEHDTLPPQTDVIATYPYKFLDKKLIAWADVGLLGSQSAVGREAKLQKLDETVREVGVVHFRGPEIVRAYHELGEKIPALEKTALILGGGIDTWNAWKSVLEPVGYHAHLCVRMENVTSAHLVGYSLVILANTGNRPLYPAEVLALRGYVAQGGSLLVVVSPGWNAAQPIVHNPLLSFFEMQVGVDHEPHARSSLIVPHPITAGVTDCTAKNAVGIDAPDAARLVQSGDKTVLAATQYRFGKVVVASFGQWFLPDTSVYGTTNWTSRLDDEFKAAPRGKLPVAVGDELHRPLLDNVVKWLCEPSAAAAQRKIPQAAWMDARQAVLEVNAHARKWDELAVPL